MTPLHPRQGRLTEAQENELIQRVAESLGVAEIAEWGFNSANSLLVRLETGIGHYAEQPLDRRGLTEERVERCLESLKRDLEAE